MQIHKLILRSLAALIAAFTAFSSIKFENSQNLVLYLGFIFSLLSLSEYDADDLFAKINIKEINSKKIKVSHIGKFFEVLSLIFYIIYIIILINQK